VFSPANDRVIVRDLGSRNGIFVNGTRVVETALNSNDVVQIGNLQIRYVSDDRPISRVAIPTPFSTVDEDLTGYRPAPTSAEAAAQSEDATSLVPSPTGSGVRPPFSQAVAAPLAPAPAASAPAPTPAPAPIKDPTPASDAQPLTVPLIPALGLVVVSAAVLVWEGMRAGMAGWLVVPLISALAGAAGVGVALASKPSGPRTSRKRKKMRRS
jgi:hypothetical protein